MNPYFLETEMQRRMADLRRDLERSRQVAELLTLRSRNPRARRRPTVVRADVTRPAEPGPA